MSKTESKRARRKSKHGMPMPSKATVRRHVLMIVAQAGANLRGAPDHMVTSVIQGAHGTILQLIDWSGHGATNDLALETVQAAVLACSRSRGRPKIGGSRDAALLEVLKAVQLDDSMGIDGIAKLHERRLASMVKAIADWGAERRARVRKN